MSPWLALGRLTAQSCSMSCANANIGISDDCIAYVSPLSVAKENQTGCDPATWTIFIRETMNGPVISSGTILDPAQLNGNVYLNRILVAEVIDGLSGNRCWAFITIEDKAAPRISCEDLTLTCDEIIDYVPEAVDNCSIDRIIKINETRRRGTCTGVCLPILFAPTEDDDPDLRNQIANLTGVPVDYFDARIGTPTLAQLLNYSWVITWTNLPYENEVLFGDNLADYVDAGGNVILGVFTSYTSGIFLSGRIMTPGYSPVVGGLNHFSLAAWDGVGPSLYFNGVSNLSAYYRDILTLQGSGIVEARFDDNEILLARRPDNKVFYVNGFSNLSGLPEPPLGEWARLIANITGCNRERNQGITSVVYQTWVAIDHVGLRDTCTVQISVLRPDFELLECPQDEIVLECSGPWAKDQRGNPHPDVTGYPTYDGKELNPWTASLYCNLMVGYTDTIFPGFCLGEQKILRRWRVSEWYCGEDRDFVCVQWIFLKDTEAPVVSCQPTLEVSTDIYSCAQELFIERPLVSDHCSPATAIRVDLQFGHTFISNFMGGVVSGFQPGTNVITFTAYDDCGNSSACTRTVFVRDEVAPIAICRTFTTASLGTEGTAWVYWPSFDDGSYDNCGVDRIEVRRMNPHPCDPEPEYREYVPVCCLDVAEEVIVLLRVWDKSGNANTCMVNLEVQDKLPAHIQCPSDVTVHCGFDLSDLSVFGKVANLVLGEQRDSIFIKGDFIGLDGFVFDNCDLTTSAESDIDLSVCGAGFVRRTFRAVGAGDNTVASCTQIIRVINDVTVLPASIIWPCDVVITNFCTDDPGRELTPAVLAGLSSGVSIARCPGNRTHNQFFDRPRFDDNECTQVGTSYKDHIFEIADSSCYKILREWKIIDWCAMEQNPGRPFTEYIYYYVQVIKLKNTIAPEITCEHPVEVCSYQDVCSTGEFLRINASAVDDCTKPEDLFWRWEYFQNSSHTATATGNTPFIQRNFPVGQHRIRFLVEDKCGNTSVCTTTVTVRDCKKPTPICHHLVIDLMITGMVDISAAVFNAGSYDNCTPGPDLEFIIERSPFSPVGDQPPPTAGPIARFTCDDLGLNDVRIWVGDDDGNWDFCETTLLVQNNAGANCLGNSGGIIAGALKTETDEAVEFAQVFLKGQTPRVLTTGVDGRFQFNNIPFGTVVEIEPLRNDEPVNGVTTLDILLIQRHILGVEELDSPYKIIAADVNDSKEITAADLVEIRKVILGKSSEFSRSNSWKFVPQNYTFHDHKNPLSENFPTTLKIPNFTGQVPHIGFVAIKMGDVNNSVVANSTTLDASINRRGSDFIVAAADIPFKSGEIVEVDIKAPKYTDLMGYQFTMAANPDFLDLIDIAMGQLPQMSYQNFGTQNSKQGYITTSWNFHDTYAISAGSTLFTLTFKALKDGTLSEVLKLNSDITKAESYDNTGGEIKGVQLVFSKMEMISYDRFELYPNRPNPFADETAISFRLPYDQEATLNIFDIQGRLLYTSTAFYTKGYHEILLHESHFGHYLGLLYCELKTDQFSAVKKMIRSK